MLRAEDDETMHPPRQMRSLDFSRRRGGFRRNHLCTPRLRPKNASRQLNVAKSTLLFLECFDECGNLGIVHCTYLLYAQLKNS